MKSCTFFKAQLLKPSAICSPSVPAVGACAAATVFVEIYRGSACVCRSCAQADAGQGPSSRLRADGAARLDGYCWRDSWGMSEGPRSGAAVTAPVGSSPCRWVLGWSFPWGRQPADAGMKVALRCWFPWGQALPWGLDTFQQLLL